MENPWVPLGTLVTTGALVMAAVRLRQGNSKKFQVWLRFRVGFQALTIFAILGGLYKYGQGNLEENQRVMEQINQQRAEMNLARERIELEQRIADAAKADEAEQLTKKGASNIPPGTRSSSGILSMVSWDKKKVESPSHPTSEPTSDPPSSSPAQPQALPSPNSGGSWWNMFNWRSSKPNSSPEIPSKKES